jgi:RNase P protein component
LPGLDIVVLSQPAASRANNRALFGSLETHWQRCARQPSDEAGTS